MSRFFVSKDSESESESETSDDEQRKIPSKHTKDFDLSDQEDDAKRTLRTAKDKRFEEIRTNIKLLKNSKKIKDISKVLEEFDGLIRVFAKSAKVVEKEGVPVFYVRTLVELEDFVVQSWTEKGSLSKINVKSLGSLRSKLRKYVKDFEGQMASFRENPVYSEDEPDQEEASEDESDEESDDDSEDDVKATKAPKGKSVKTKGGKAKVGVSEDEDDDDESDSENWSDDSESSSTDDSDNERYRNDPAARFLKKDPSERNIKKEDDLRGKIRKQGRTGHGREKVKVIDEDGFVSITDKPKLFSKDADINVAVVLKKLSEIIAQRGKKATDRQEQIELIEELRVVSQRAGLGAAMDIRLRLALVSAVFDYNPNMASNMKTDMWKRLLEAIADLLTYLIEHGEVEVGEDVLEDQENYDVTAGPLRVHGLPLALVERMDEEFTKVLQNCDAHSPDYVENLKSELKVNQIIERMQFYLESHDADRADLCRIYERRISHLYFKIDYKYMARKKEGGVVGEGGVKGGEGAETTLDVMDRICAYIYNNDDTDRIRLRAILMRVYHLALHDEWYAARDLMLMSKAQETINLADPPTQVLYNRAMVQLGISAFRAGNINEAHNALMDIQSSGRPKELLAQGLLPVRQHERSAEQEKIEKRRQIPFHMHINLDVLECVYLVSAMFIEVPYLAAHENDQRRRIISKYFYHSMKQSERHALSGPPETLPEYVIAASKAMKMGDWKKCRGFILSEKLNKRVWDFFYQADKIREVLARRIQESSMRCFMFTNSAFYDAISVQTLSEMFELSKEEILSLIGKMIVSEDLAASVDEPSQTVIMHRTEPSRVQQLSLQLADKLTSFVESNERMLEMKNPNFQRGGNKGWQDRRQHGGGGGGQDRQHGGGGGHQQREQREVAGY